MDADQEESGGEEPSLEDVTGGGGAETWEISERTWSVATDILHWLCVCVCVSVFAFAERSCASTDLFFGVVTSGDGWGRRASALGVEQPLKITSGDGSGGFFAAGMKMGGAFLVLCLSQLETKTPGSARSVVLSQGTCLVVM